MKLEPYPGLTNLEVLKVVLEGGRNEPPPNCPKEIKEIMVECWKDSPILRPSWKQIFSTLESINVQTDKIYKY